MRKRLSRRRLKARFMRGRSIALQDVYERGLVEFVTRWGYEMSSLAMIRRYFEPIKVVLEEFSAENVRAIAFGESCGII